MNAHRNERALAERVHPILIPQHTQQLRVQTRLEDLDLELIILPRVHAKVLDLAQRDALVLGSGTRSTGRGVVLREGAEGADVDLAGGDGAVGVDDDGDEGVLELLVVELGVDVYTREPAAISRVRVVPSDGVFEAACFLALVDVLDHVLVRLARGVDTRLCALDGQCKRVHDDERVAHHLALHQAHDLVRDARARVDHLWRSTLTIQH